MREKLLTQDEVARVTGWSVRHIRRSLKSVPGAKGRNGRPTPMYPLSIIPAEARQKWMATFGWGAVAGGQQVTHEVLIGEDEVRRLCSGVIPPGAQPVYRPAGETPAVQPHPDQLPLELPAPIASSMSPEDRAVAERRYAIIEPLVASERHQALWRQFAGKGALVAFLAQQHHTPARTLYRWIERWKGAGRRDARATTDGLAALVDRDRSDRGRSRVLTPAVQRYIASALLPAPADGRNGKPGRGELSIREIYRAYEEERAWRADHPDAGAEPLPHASYETFRLWAAKIPAVVRDVAARGDQDYFNRHALVTWRDIAALDPLEYVVMDHRLADFFCMTRDPGRPWRLVRPWLTAAIDMRTRKWLAWIVCLVPSSDSIAACIMRAILDHGLLYRDGKCATCFYWDNGKDFRAEYLEGPAGGDASATSELPLAMRGVMDSLGARVKHALPMRPHSKIIEPNFLRVSNFDRTLPWWCGHKPQARPERFTRLVREHESWMAGKREQPAFVDDRGMPFTLEYAAWLYDEALTTLNQRPLEGRGMEKAVPNGRAWLSPDECWGQLIGGIDRRSADPAVLQFCFHRRRPLTVRQGEIRPTFAGRQYHYRLAGDSQSLMLLNGRLVAFAYDPCDLGTAALYADDRFIGLAHSVELSRMGEESFVQDERDRRSALKTIKGYIAAIQTGDVAPVEERARRREAARAMLPEPVRPAPTMPLPEAIEQAAAAAAADAAFSFSRGGANPASPLSSSSTSEEVRSATAGLASPPPAGEEDDGEFRFFGR